MSIGHKAGQRPWQRRALEYLAALAGFAVVVCLVTAPLVLQLDSAMLAGKFQWSHAWAMELVHTGISERSSLWLTQLQVHPDAVDPLMLLWGDTPYTLQTDALNYPEGGTIVFLGWFNLLTGALLRGVLPFLSSFNLSVLLVLTLAPWAAYLLARSVGAGRLGAAVGGLVFGFNPYVLAVVSNGQMAKYNHVWVALIALLAWQLTRRLRWWAVPALWIAATICLASSPYYFVFSGLLGLSLGLYGLGVQAGWKRRGLLLALLLVCAAGVLVLDAPLLSYFAHREGSLIKPSNAGADTTAFELTASIKTLLLPLECTYRQGVRIPDEIHVSYLGLFALLLALACSWARRWRGTGFWWAVALIFVVLALGREAELPGGRAVTLPLGYLAALLPQGRGLIFVYRAVVVVYLALGVIIALGLSELLQRLPGRPLLRRLAAVAVVGLLALDFLWISPAPFPLPVEAQLLPRAYQDLPREPRTYGIVEFPCELEALHSSDAGKGSRDALALLNQRQIFYQAFHHQGLGMVDKGNDYRPAYRTPLLREMIAITAGSAPSSTTPSLQWLRQNHFRRLMLHEAQIPPAALGPLKRYLGRVLPRSRRYAAEQITAYEF